MKPIIRYTDGGIAGDQGDRAYIAVYFRRPGESVSTYVYAYSVELDPRSARLVRFETVDAIYVRVPQS